MAKNNRKNSGKNKIKNITKKSNSYFMRIENRDITDSAEFKKSFAKITEFDLESIRANAKKAIDSDLQDSDLQDSSIDSSHSADSSNSISSLLTLNDPGQFPNRDLFAFYCNKTGRFLRYRDINELYASLETLKPERINYLLSLQFGDHYSIEWLDTGPDSLHILSQTDPVGYFIYTASLVQHKMMDFGDDAVQEINQRNEFLRDKIAAHLQLENEIKINPDCLINIQITNELLRRLLGLIKPSNIWQAMRYKIFDFGSLKSCTKSTESILNYQDSIKFFIKFLLEQHFKNISAARLAQFEKQKAITYADLYAIKTKNGGLANFHLQPKLKNCSKRESILFDMLDFVDFDAQDQDLLADFDAADEFIEASVEESLEDQSYEMDFSNLKINSKKIKKSNNSSSSIPSPSLSTGLALNTAALNSSGKNPKSAKFKLQLPK